jgi:aminomethyltransferase
MADFAGWDMPIQYPTGIVEEHLRTRRGAGLFDVSHMGRFRVSGPRSRELLDAVLTSDVGALRVGGAQYALLPTDSGGALDDAFLYRTGETEYHLVVNAGNRERDWERLREAWAAAEDRSEELAMISLQGPRSPELLAASGLGSVDPVVLASPRNTVWRLTLAGASCLAARTGYAGESLGFELIVEAALAARVWNALADAGAVPVGLGARDTLRLEAGLPLYGHELGIDPEGREIPAYACPQARTAVRIAPGKAGLRGFAALGRQAEAWRLIRSGRAAEAKGELPRLVRQLSLTEPGVARAGAKVWDAGGGRQVGWITSGTVVPTWVFRGAVGAALPTEQSGKRSALLGLLDSEVGVGADVRVEVRGRLLAARVVTRLLDSRTPPYAVPVGGA